jgi:hypothetical protein
MTLTCTDKSAFTTAVVCMNCDKPLIEDEVGDSLDPVTGRWHPTMRWCAIEELGMCRAYRAVYDQCAAVTRWDGGFGYHVPIHKATA